MDGSAGSHHAYAILVLIAGALAIATGAIALLVPLAMTGSGSAIPASVPQHDPERGAVRGGGSRWASRPDATVRWIVAAAALYAIGGVLFGLSTTTVIAVVACIAYGASITLLDVLARTLLQRTTGDDLLTRVFGAVEALWLLAYAAGAAIAPVLESRIGLPVSFAVLGCAMLVAGVVSLAGLRRIDQAAVVPERQPSCSPPSRCCAVAAHRPRVGRQLDLIDPAGTELIRQGTGDRFYVVDAGASRSCATARGSTPPRRAAISQIALPHDAAHGDVRAIADGAVWALDQEEFLATVTGLPQAARAAHKISAERRRTDAPDGRDEG